MSTTIRVFLTVALAAIFAAPLQALTYIVPSDAEMIQRSDDIVVAVALASTVERSQYDGIVTRYTFRIEEVLKGHRSASQHLVVTELGGQLGDFMDFVPGRPEYHPGERYLIFTESNREGDPITFGYALGQFHLRKTADREYAIRSEIHGFTQNLESFTDRGRDAVAFRRFIRETVAGRHARADYFLSAEAQRGVPASNAFAVSSYLSLSTGSGLPWRRQDPSFSFVFSQDQPGGDEAAATATAISEWNGTGTDIAMSNGGRNDAESCSICSSSFDGVNVIEYNVPSLTGGAVGIARYGGGGSHQFGGETFTTIQEGDVTILGSSFAQCVLDSIVTHEVGHTLGFRHSNQAPAGTTCGTTAECTSSAIMNSSVGCSNGELRAYDQTAADAAYGDGVPSCTPPAITTHPAASTNLTLGSTVQLSVTASGSAPLSYQWYSGLSPDTSEPIAGATTNKLNVTPQVAGTFAVWVRVSNGCDNGRSVNSNTALVVATCAGPAITTGPQSVTISQGQSTQLSVTATGAGLSYMWFKGEAGDRSNPVGTNSNKLVVSPSETTKYWVRVNGTCGPGVDSAAATVTVNACAALTVNAPTATRGTGNNYTLGVTASSTATPLTFEWFRGSTPGVGGEKVGSTQNVNVTVATPTTFWARVKNACGRTEVSSLLAVGCTLPSITTQPEDQTINSGQTANLAIVSTGGTGVKWYRGVVGDKSAEVGSASNVTVGPLTETTLFWAEVSSACGPVASRQVTVTVQALSELVPMLGGRFFVQVNYKNQFDGGKEGKLLGRSLFSTPLSETLVFTFGDPNVVELLVRLSDARPFDDSIHVFLGGLSDVEFSVVVTDSLTGIIHEYKKPANELVGVIDRQTFPAAASALPPIDTASLITPAAETSTIVLLNRFEVRMRYRNQFTNPAGEGYMNARSIASSPATETAVFFFDENVGSVEWMVRFSDARPFVERIDMFHGGLSDVEFTIEVHDTKTGERREYHKGPFSLRGQVDRDNYRP